MATLAVRKTAWQGLSVRNRTILRAIGDVLQLGVPAEFQAGGGAKWFVFDDHRFKPKVIAYFGTLVANLSSIPSGYSLPLDGDGEVDKAQLRSDAKGFLDPLLVWPVPGATTWQDILDAQGTPASVQMVSGVPDTWTAVGA